jgi:hypothetical protein
MCGHGVFRGALVNVSDIATNVCSIQTIEFITIRISACGGCALQLAHVVLGGLNMAQSDPLAGARETAHRVPILDPLTDTARTHTAGLLGSTATNSGLSENIVESLGAILKRSSAHGRQAQLKARQSLVGMP